VQAEALEALEQAGYLDDARYACARAEQLAGRGYGDEWIRADLERQGVGAEAIGDAIGGLVPEAERARQEWQQLAGGIAAARTLARRGFAEETLEALLAQPPGRGVG
jgi:SOS response regulatory protein OraA/RecX